MGASPRQIHRIFMLQGVLIGIVGSAFGLVLGYTLCYYANKYQWVKLDQTIYALSFLATLYPARNATRIAPAEVLRYE